MPPASGAGKDASLTKPRQQRRGVRARGETEVAGVPGRTRIHQAHTRSLAG